jgi:hypothetical protein
MSLSDSPRPDETPPELLQVLAVLATGALPPTLDDTLLQQLGLPALARPWHVYSPRPIRVGDHAIPLLIDGPGYTGPGSVAIDNLAAWVGYTLDIIGWVYPGTFPAFGGRYWTITLAEHATCSSVGLQPWRQRVISHDSPTVYAEVLQIPGDWDRPGTDTRRWDLWEHTAIHQQRRMETDPTVRPSPDEQARAEHGLALLRQLAVQAEQDSRERQLAEAAARIRAGRRVLDRESLAAEFGVAKRTIDKWARPFGGLRAVKRTPLADLQQGHIMRAKKGDFAGAQ